jgi:hypothetical protein
MPDPVTSEHRSRLRRPENVAAIVNALIVLLVPFGLGIVDKFDFIPSNAVRPRKPSGAVSLFVSVIPIALWVMQLIPLALLVGWRTRVHAQRYRNGLEMGWSAVAESGALGFVLALVVLTPGIVTRPTEAGPYVFVYGGGALILGLAIGTFLRMTAIIVLKLQD